MSILFLVFCFPGSSQEVSVRQCANLLWHCEDRDKYFCMKSSSEVLKCCVCFKLTWKTEKALTVLQVELLPDASLLTPG